MTKHLCVSLTNRILAAAFLWACAFLVAPSQATGSPTYCEHVIIEYQAALDRGDISEREYWKLVKKCQRFEQRR